MMGLGDGDRARVEAAVKAAEKRTAAQFALVVAHASDDYALYPIMCAALLALGIGVVVALAVPGLGTWWIAGIEAALFVVADLIFHVKPVRHLLVPPKVKRVHAQRLARLEFAALVHNRTVGDVGLLLFISEAERHVEILVDRGIAEGIAQGEWKKIVADFVAAVRAGEVAKALIGAVEASTALLERHFPPKPGAAKAIPDRVTEV